MKLPRKINSLIENPWTRWLAVLAPIVAITMLKVSFTEITFSYLYLLPIAFSVWWFGWRKSLLVAILCAFLGWVMTIQVGNVTDAVAYWNTLLRLAVFAGFVLFLQMFRWELDRQAFMADTDPHTGILNIRGFYNKAQQRLDEANEKKQAVALIYLDVDDFKKANDRFGHLEGDRILQMVALSMRTLFRSPDLIGRFGGDEFLVFLTGLPPHVVESRVNEFRLSLSSRMQAENWPITFSMGCIIYTEPPGSLERIVHSADALAYEVKNSGKNGLKIDIQ